MKQVLVGMAIIMATANVVYFMTVSSGDDHHHGDPDHLPAGDHADHHAPPSLSEVFTANNPAGDDNPDEPQASGWRFWASVANFTLLLLILVTYGRDPMRSFLSNRKNAIAHGLEEARQMQEAAQQRYDEYTERLANLNEELEAIRTEMTKAGEAERDRIVQEAEAKAARMRKDAEFLIGQQIKQLREDLTKEAVDAAISAAEAVLRDKTTAQDQERLAQSYLDHIATGGGRA